MTDITSVLTSLCTIVLFGTFLVARRPRWPHLAVMFLACGTMFFLFAWKYFFGHPVLAPIGRDLAFWVGMGTSLASVAVCLLAVRKSLRQMRARQAGAP